MVSIRPETPEDVAAIRHVNESAFGRPAEANLVDALRATVHPYLSLVADLGGACVGHICFSPVEIADEHSASTALGLAPMAVLPAHQGKGIGTRLVQEGLLACRRLGHEVVFVLGHADYYPRFGFRPASRYGLHSEYDVPDEVFMVVELAPGALRGRRGRVTYAAAFHDVT